MDRSHRSGIANSSQKRAVMEQKRPQFRWNRKCQMLVLDVKQSRLCIRGGLRRLSYSASRAKPAITPQERRMRGAA
jgi:hypothetical protein